MFLSPEQRAVGKVNFCAAIGSPAVRREFLLKQIKAGVRSGQGLGPLYFGYGDAVPEPVRVGVIGTGDEGSVLIGAINPKYLAVRAIADVRPYNVHRALHGDCYSEAALKARPGLLAVYDWKSEEAARSNVKVYGAYQELLAHAKQDGLEAVIIALPLHLHAAAAIAALRAGLHVLTEKLMAHSVHECKEMARVAQQTGLLLATGHQRHYNILYDSAVELIRRGVLGQLHYIRAQWHRGNLPGNDSWQQPMPEKLKPTDRLAKRLAKELGEWQKDLKDLQKKVEAAKKDEDREKLQEDLALLTRKIAQKQAQIRDEEVKEAAKKYGYEDLEVKNAAGKVLYERPAPEELLRWRLWDRTGGGLMAELGSHQLDAASIFIAAMHEGHKQYPLSVAAAANRPLFPPDRQIEDHVYCLFEFPAPGYQAEDAEKARKKIGVQYASINGNGFGGYGETVFGTEGTLLLETEKEALLYKTSDTTSKTKVVAPKGGKAAVLQTDEAGDEESAAIGQLATLPAERGYTEELEHWAWCIRNPAPENQPRCHPRVALGDAVIALATNLAARQGSRLEFQPAWFDPDRDETPEDVKPDVSRYA
jgi:predicted dehydrogenase